VIGIIYASQKAIDRWSAKTWPGGNSSERENEMACTCKGAKYQFSSNSESVGERGGCDGYCGGDGDGDGLRDGDLMVVAITRLPLATTGAHAEHSVDSSSQKAR
jgi:hypothetical protein